MQIGLLISEWVGRGTGDEVPPASTCHDYYRNGAPEGGALGETSKFITTGCSPNAATYIRPPLKKKIVYGPAAGCVYYCRMGTFFFILPPKNSFGQNFIIFSPTTTTKNGKKRRFCSRLTGHNLGHPLDRKQTFF